MLAYENKEITLHQKIEVVRTVTTPDGEKHTGFVECTLGRLIFNEIIPQDLGFVRQQIQIILVWSQKSTSMLIRSS